MKVWSGSAWLVAYASGSGYMLAGNNLSELTNTTSARSNLGLGSIATQSASSVSISGGSITGITDLTVADGGTGASDAATARTNLGLGSIATQSASSVSISGGSITGITDLAIADGGTGASNAATALSNLGGLAAASYTAADVLSKLLTVDGSSSSLDADLLDGQHGSYYAPASRSISAGSGLTGGGNLTADRTISLPTVVTAGSVGSSSAIPVLTYDAYGRITAASSAAIAGAGLVLLDTKSPSGASYIDFASGLNSTYDEYEIVFALDQSADAEISLRVSTDGGSSYDTGSNYKTAMLREDSSNNTAGTVESEGSSGASAIKLVKISDGDTNAANYVYGRLSAMWLASTSHKKLFQFTAVGANVNDVHLMHCRGGGMWVNTTAVNALRIYPSTGTFSGKAYLYGKAKS